jgi:CRISPR/Cas system CMR subunit Cmr6 (Cas7 group RAMP superfamily)
VSAQKAQQIFQVSADALIEMVQASHKATNDLMAVQFESVKAAQAANSEAVKENINRLHTTLAIVKADLQAEAAKVREQVEEHRKISDERHLSLVKKVWMGVGGVAAIEAILAWHPWGRV